jgi:uncharacterized membrane protein (UPF0127 family)
MAVTKDRFRLVREGEDLCELELAQSASARMRGLLGRDGIKGAMLIRPASSIHTFGMRFAIDVAYLNGDLLVLRAVTMPPNRMGPLVRRTRAVLEAEAGAFARWGLRPGDRLHCEVAG